MNAYNPNDIYEYRLIKAGNIISSQNYQRRIKKKHVEDIIKDFDPYQVDPLKIVIRNGKNYLFNGQHTLSAIRTKFGDCVYVPCLVFKKTTPQMEAKLFAEQDKHHSKLQTHEELKANYYEGRNEAILFHNIIEKYGFDCDFIPARRERKISGYSYLYKNIFTAYGVARLETVLNVVKNAYNYHPYSTSANVLKAINNFVTFFENDGIDMQRLISAMRKIDPSKIANESKRFREINKLGISESFAEVVRREYNSGHKKGNMSAKYFD